MIVKRTFFRHGINAIIFGNKAKTFRKEQFHPIHLFQGNAKEFFKIPLVNFCAIRRPEEPIYHSLPLDKSCGERGWELFFINSLAIFFNIEGIYLKLISQKSCCGAAETKEIFARH